MLQICKKQLPTKLNLETGQVASLSKKYILQIIEIQP